MTAKYEFSLDHARHLLRITMRGYWTIEDLHAFVGERRVVLTKAGWTAGNHVCLIDLRDYAVQSKEFHTEAHKVASDPRNKLARLAILHSSVLVKMQGDRTIPDDNRRFFDVEAEAIAWLMGASNNAAAA